MSEQVYKWLDGTQSTHGGTGRWQKGRWRSVKGELVPCENGLHLCREQDLVLWVARSLWLAEHDGELLDAVDKVVVRRARVVERLAAWNERTARLFAADCAERVLRLFEAKYPNDDRPRKAIEAARAFARGEIDAVARDAARDAAWDAAWDAAGDAARDAAWDAARAAAWAAARDAAWAAAGAAAGAAAAAAARDAAGAALRDAAGAAEREWQSARLLDYAHGGAA